MAKQIAGLQQMDLSTLARLDNGKIDRMLKWHLQRVASDMLGRAVDGKKRDVTLTLTFTPVRDEAGELTNVRMSVEAKSKIPPHRTAECMLDADRNGIQIPTAELMEDEEAESTE